MTHPPRLPIPSLADLGVPPAVRDCLGEVFGGMVLFFGPDMDANRELMLAAVIEHRDRHVATYSVPHRQRGIMSTVRHALPDTCEILDTEGMLPEEVDRRFEWFVHAYWDPTVMFTDMEVDGPRAARLWSNCAGGTLTFACIQSDNLDQGIMDLWRAWFAHMHATTGPDHGYQPEERWAKERFWGLINACVFRLDAQGPDGPACLTHHLVIDDATVARLAGMHSSKWPSAILAQANWSEPKTL